MNMTKKNGACKNRANAEWLHITEKKMEHEKEQKKSNFIAIFIELFCMIKMLYIISVFGNFYGAVDEFCI